MSFFWTSKCTLWNSRISGSVRGWHDRKQACGKREKSQGNGTDGKKLAIAKYFKCRTVLLVRRGRLGVNQAVPVLEVLL